MVLFGISSVFNFSLLFSYTPEEHKVDKCNIRMKEIVCWMIFILHLDICIRVKFIYVQVDSDGRNSCKRGR